MNITKNESIATLGVLGTVGVGTVYLFDVSWPFFNSATWIIGSLAILGAIILTCGFIDTDHSSDEWDILGILFGVILATLTFLGLIYPVSAYVVALMLTSTAIWLAMLLHHLLKHDTSAMLHT